MDFDNWTKWTFVLELFEAVASSRVGAADSFAEPYRDDQVRPHVHPACANEAIARRRNSVLDETICRRVSDIPEVRPSVQDGATIGDADDRTISPMYSLRTHKTRRHGRWSLPRFQTVIGTSTVDAWASETAA